MLDRKLSPLLKDGASNRVVERSAAARGERSATGATKSDDEDVTDRDPLNVEAASPAPVPLPTSAISPMTVGELREYEGLFLLLCRLRGASADSLWRLFLLRTLGITSRSAAMRRIERLNETGYLQHKRLSVWRSIYHLTHRALVAFPRVRASGSDTLRKPQSTSQAHYCWLRAGMHAELVGDGYIVGRGPRELAALRRFYVDGQLRRIEALPTAARGAAEQLLLALRREESLKPPFRARCARCGSASPLNVAVAVCSRCGGTTKNEIPLRVYQCRTCGRLTDEVGPHARPLDEADEALPPSPSSVPSRVPPCSPLCSSGVREVDVLSIDIAWRRTGDSYDVIGLFIDDPRRAIARQLEQIPAQLVGLPLLPLIVRSTDQRSRFDARTLQWRAKGPRHQALLRAFAADVHEALFPFALTTKVIDYRPELELWASYAGVKR